MNSVSLVIVVFYTKSIKNSCLWPRDKWASLVDSLWRV